MNELANFLRPAGLGWTTAPPILWCSGSPYLTLLAAWGCPSPGGGSFPGSSSGQGGLNIASLLLWCLAQFALSPWRSAQGVLSGIWNCWVAQCIYRAQPFFQDLQTWESISDNKSSNIMYYWQLFRMVWRGKCLNLTSKEFEVCFLLFRVF